MLNKSACVCLSAVLHGNNLLVFGGTGIPFGENNGNDVHVCNVQYKRWNLLSCRGKKPNKIYGQVAFPPWDVRPLLVLQVLSVLFRFQAMIIINDYLYVFGGTTGYLYSTDLHRLDLTTREWSHLKPNNVPSDLPEERSDRTPALIWSCVWDLRRVKLDGKWIYGVTGTDMNLLMMDKGSTF